MDNGLHKPLTDGQGSYSYIPQGNMASLQGSGNGDLMWLLLERLMDFSMQCRHSANAYARSQTGQVGPVLQELMTLLRTNGAGGGYGGQYGGGYNNSFMIDKIAYLVSKLERYENSYPMDQNSPQLPSAGPVLEILFQMLRNENNTPAKDKPQQEFPEHIQKHLKELGERMLKMNNVPSEGQTLDLLLSMLSNELSTNPEVNAQLIQNKEHAVAYQKGSFSIYAKYNPGGGSMPLASPNGQNISAGFPALFNGSDKEKSELEKMKEELRETNKRESLWHIKKGYSALDKKDFRTAFDHFRRSNRSISLFGFSDKETNEIQQLTVEMMEMCKEEINRKGSNRSWWGGSKKVF